MEQKKQIRGNFKSGNFLLQQLTHKNGTRLSDLEYFELLGRKCIEIDKKNTSSYMPSDYGSYDVQVVAVAKDICKALDEGIPRKELADYLKQIIKDE